MTSLTDVAHGQISFTRPPNNLVGAAKSAIHRIAQPSRCLEVVTANFTAPLLTTAPCADLIYVTFAPYAGYHLVTTTWKVVAPISRTKASSGVTARYGTTAAAVLAIVTSTEALVT